jgi:hypothetical protein
MSIEPITRYNPDAVAIRIFIKESERKVLKDVCETEGTNMSHLARALLLQWLKSKSKEGDSHV